MPVDTTSKPLSGEDLDRLADDAFLRGAEEESTDWRAQAVDAFLDEGNPGGAARSAFWLGMALSRRGEEARGGGWLARASRLLEDQPPDATARAYPLVPQALGASHAGDITTAEALWEQVRRAGSDGGDHDLSALGLIGLGEVQVRQRDLVTALSLFDEAMVGVLAGEVSPIPTGIVYCAAVASCRAVGDFQRAKEWTTALNAWCDQHPDMVPFRGQCMIHRSEILQLQGDWPAAMAVVAQACEVLSGPPQDPAVGAASYQRGELYRLRGEHAAADRAYRAASDWGHSPQPGLAFLRLAEGHPEVARAALTRAVEEQRSLADGGDPTALIRLLAARVEVGLSMDDADAARHDIDELDRVADAMESGTLHAIAAEARGAVLLAEGSPGPALAVLRAASAHWREADAPFEAARARVLIGLACRDMGDQEGCALELGAAREAFQRLGAMTELARLERAAGNTPSPRPAGLTAREIEVLRLVADGATNKTVAATLVLSEHTVARHLQNIFVKLGVESRTAAAAFAYQHGLV